VRQIIEAKRVQAATLRKRAPDCLLRMRHHPLDYG
jgi:hypothetical protein